MVESGNVTDTITDLLSTTLDHRHKQQQLINTQLSYREPLTNTTGRHLTKMESHRECLRF